MASRRWLLAAYLLQAVLLLWVLVPFLRYNNLLEWDFPGHYVAIWHLKSHLLPWPSGWNPLFYCGYPQGLFYPPLAHYLAALLSFAFGTAVSMKLLVLTSLLLLPVVFYAFSRRWQLDELQSAVCSLWMTALLFVSGDSLGTWTLGSDLKSIINVGLFANALSLPVLFAFLASFGSDAGPRTWKWAAILLGTLLLLHPLSSLIAILFILSLLLARLWEKGHNLARWRPVLLSLGSGLLLGSVWILPFAAYRGLMNPEFTPARWSPAVQLIGLNGAALAVVCAVTQRLRPLALTYLMLSNFILIGTQFELHLQFSRLTVFLLFLIPAFLLVWVRSRWMLALLAMLAFGVGIAGYRHSGIHPAGVPDFPVPDFGAVQGRILSVSPPSHLPSYHVGHELIPLRTGNQSMLGLFIESSLNGRFVGNLALALEPESHIWGTPTEILNRQALGKDFSIWVQDRLRLFAVRYVFTDLKLEGVLDPSLGQSKRYCSSYPMPGTRSPEEEEFFRKRYNTHGAFFDFYLYPVGSSTLAEPLAYLPPAVTSDWKRACIQWFVEARGVPVFTDRAAPATARAARQNENVELVELSPTMDRITLQIHADQDIPVLVKIGYFPTWQLELNNSRSPVYRASPNLILIFGHGRATLAFHRPWQEYLGLALSALGLLLIILL